MRKVIIMGAAGRDFHNFNVYFRDNPDYRVVAFTATQIPDIEGRKYPAALAGKLYPRGIPIYSESELTDLIKEHKVGDYYTDFYYDCIVTHKMETAAGYKVYPKFILVLRLDDNRRFDIDVTPTCWANAEVGEKLTFKLSESDIEFIPSKQHWSLLAFFLWFPFAGFLLSWIIVRFFSDEN